MLLRCGRLAAVGLLLALAGCVAPTLTSRIGDGISKLSLKQEVKGVALLSAGVNYGGCRQVYVTVGTRNKTPDKGAGIYSPVKGLMIQPAKAPVAEIKLDPGEYHIVAFICANRGSSARLVEAVDGFWPSYRRSYATFTVQAGEVVNIGYLRIRYLGAADTTISADLAVGDWPQADLARFKQQRPELYAQMKTRLMRLNRITPAEIAERCAEMRRLKSEGKLQNLPPGCTAPAPAAKRSKGLGI